jgi:hypothetical protein
VPGAVAAAVAGTDTVAVAVRAVATDNRTAARFFIQGPPNQ